jgi:hypothetical protein
MRQEEEDVLAVEEAACLVAYSAGDGRCEVRWAHLVYKSTV